MADTIWKVAMYMDSIREVDAAKARRRQWFHTIKNYELFDTEREAIDFLVARAERLRDEAEDEAAKADKRLTKCLKIQRNRFRL